MKSFVLRSLWKVISFAATRVAGRYLAKDRTYTYKKFRMKIFSHVFHPGLFRSTKAFAEWLETQNIKGKKVLEIGSGSGLVSLVAAAKEAIVTATDINRKAVENTRLNAEMNGLHISTIHSDLFATIPEPGSFDIVLVNPPYYPKQPRNDYEKAWYCGPGYEYFSALFAQLKQHAQENNCYMILSDTCDLNAIKKIAGDHQLMLTVVSTKKISGEALIVYKTGTVNPPPGKRP